MGSDIQDSTDAVLESFAPLFAQAIHNTKVSMGVKHKRRLHPTKNRVKLKRKNGVITVMSIGTNKGEIMSHKGKGANPDKRREKPFINEPGDNMLPQLADELANVTGDVICYQLVK